MGFLESKVKAMASSELNPAVAKNRYVRMDGAEATVQSDRGVDSDVEDELEIDEDCVLAWAEKNRTKRNATSRKYVFSCAIFDSLNSVLLGYDVGVMSGTILFIHEEDKLKVTQVQQEILVGCLTVVSLFGSLAVPPEERTSGGGIGRKWAMGLAPMP